MVFETLSSMSDLLERLFCLRRNYPGTENRKQNRKIVKDRERQTGREVNKGRMTD